MERQDTEEIEEHKEEIAQYYLAYHEKISRYVGTTLKDPWLIEDIVQETFAEAVRHADTFQNHPKKTGWLFQTARNKIHEVLRKWNLPGEEGTYQEEALDIGKYEDGYAMTEFHMTLQEVLTDEERMRFHRYFVCGYSIHEMAALEQISENNMSVRISRLRSKLREAGICDMEK